MSTVRTSTEIRPCSGTCDWPLPNAADFAWTIPSNMDLVDRTMMQASMSLTVTCPKCGARHPVHLRKVSDVFRVAR